jgi:hypothetical protein
MLLLALLLAGCSQTAAKPAEVVAKRDFPAESAKQLRKIERELQRLLGESHNWKPVESGRQTGATEDVRERAAIVVFAADGLGPTARRACDILPKYNPDAIKSAQAWAAKYGCANMTQEHAHTFLVLSEFMQKYQSESDALSKLKLRQDRLYREINNILDESSPTE